jgi:hypothetical protein
MNDLDLFAVIFMLLIFAAPIGAIVAAIAKDREKTRKMAEYWHEKWPTQEEPASSSLLRPTAAADADALMRPAGTGGVLGNLLKPVPDMNTPDESARTREC